jgi:Ni/Co efflux regulator RcnB
MEHSMTIKIAFSAIVTLSLITVGASFAQNADRNDHGRNGEEQRSERQDHRQNQGPSSHNEQRAERGAGPNHAFYKGGRLPAQYHNKQYVLDDWRGHHLSAPPRGYHWVQTGSDYVLVAIATGIILQLLLNN